MSYLNLSFLGVFRIMVQLTINEALVNEILCHFPSLLSALMICVNSILLECYIDITSEKILISASLKTVDV
jgi:hypothetical protein